MCVCVCVCECSVCVCVCICVVQLMCNRNLLLKPMQLKDWYLAAPALTS